MGASCAIWFYLYKALLPLNLCFFYPQWEINAGNMLYWLPLAAAANVTILLMIYRKTWSRPLLFAWGFYCVALCRALGIIDTNFMKYSLVADHYQHIALIGAVALAGAGFHAGAAASGWDRAGRLPPSLSLPRAFWRFLPGGNAEYTKTSYP